MADLSETSDGILRYGEPNLTNELLNDSKPGHQDPVAYRGGTHVGGSLRKDSGDRLVGSQRLERTAIVHKEDPDGAGRIEFYTQGPGQNGDMNASHLRLTLSKNGITWSDTVVSANGYFKAQLQGDGNLVVTNLLTGQPVWSWMTGPL